APGRRTEGPSTGSIAGRADLLGGALPWQAGAEPPTVLRRVRRRRRGVLPRPAARGDGPAHGGPRRARAPGGAPQGAACLGPLQPRSPAVHAGAGAPRRGGELLRAPGAAG